MTASLFTFFDSNDDGDSCATQTSAPAVSEAIDSWVDSLLKAGVMQSGSDDVDDPIAIEGVSRVWFVNYEDVIDRFHCVNVVETLSSPDDSSNEDCAGRYVVMLEVEGGILLDESWGQGARDALSSWSATQTTSYHPSKVTDSQWAAAARRLAGRKPIAAPGLRNVWLVRHDDSHRTWICWIVAAPSELATAPSIR